MVYQWYPGHMSKAKREMQNELKLVDLVIELVDARAPFSSKNPDIDYLAKDKKRIIIMNKADLADDVVTNQFKRYYENKGFAVLISDARNKAKIKGLDKLIQEVMKEKIEKDRKKGILNKPVRAMIAGIPNVGKSTFINTYFGKASAKTGNKPGVTTSKQWIRLGQGVELLDTPGLLWPKFENQIIGLRIALIGSINENILDEREMACKLIEFLKANYKGLIENKYGIAESDEEAHIILEKIADKKACRKKGNELDLDRMSKQLLDDYRAGKIGKITLDRVLEEFPDDERRKAES
ncbi:MAG: ribosome biogenesis GTPase YlqF [Lachnospiraceae bacterium]|nr:ribosome biogenesis GTPase YlqF [Lachnospiraceae bacterium]